MGLFSIFMGAAARGETIKDSSSMIVIDVRTASEYSEGHVKDAINIDVTSSEFKTKVEQLDKNKTYKVYCRSGNRSGQAERQMKALGFKDVENIGGVQQAAPRLNRQIVK